ncbi:MAG: TlpA family protein disulfide reductase [Aureispira sp.]
MKPTNYWYPLLFVGVCFQLLVSCRSSMENAPLNREPQEWLSAGEKAVGYYTYEQFEKLLQGNNDTTYVVNFWATWCAPCVKELPHFQKLYEQYKDQKVHLILVSLDFEDQLERKLYPFLKKKQLDGEVLLLSQKGMNDWIGKINSDWEGELPATLLYKGAKQQFYAQSFEYDELEIKLRRFMNL